MKMIFVLIILAVILLAFAIVIFFWAVRSRQFDDLDIHAYNVLKEDDYEVSENTSGNEPHTQRSDSTQLNDNGRTK